MRTLRNAVERGKVHHAYLFVGSRGTGKTSMAKILAACLNCERGPTIEPCGQCESCVSIARATSLDVIEMDAASNNSVDDIRELRESVAYAPVSGRRKVYILDEAHMLSTAAWNAFLKTLEEPPPNTVFVLATTEANKVPATVVDRCHRFDFHRPTVEQIASVVRRAAEAESIEIPPEAVAALARSATGSFRDALGTLEQLVTYSGTKIALRGRAGGARRGGRAAAGRDRRRGRGRRLQARADGAGGVRRAGTRRRLVRVGPGGARARAAGRADPRRGAGRAVAHPGGGRGAGRAGRARGARDGRPPAGAARARRWRPCARARTRAPGWSWRW